MPRPHNSAVYALVLNSRVSNVSVPGMEKNSDLFKGVQRYKIIGNSVSYKSVTIFPVWKVCKGGELPCRLNVNNILTIWSFMYSFLQVEKACWITKFIIKNTLIINNPGRNNWLRPRGKESTEVWIKQNRNNKGKLVPKKWRGLRMKGTSKLKEQMEI